MIMDDGGGGGGDDDDDCHGFGGSDDTADLLALLFRKKAGYQLLILRTLMWSRRVVSLPVAASRRVSHHM